MEREVIESGVIYDGYWMFASEPGLITAINSP